MNEDPNPYKLEVDNQYWFRYTGCKSEWFSGMVTHFTKFGHPWVEATDGAKHRGIISPGLYNVEKIIVEARKHTLDEVLDLITTFNLSTSYKTVEEAKEDVPRLFASKRAAAKEWFEQNIIKP